MRGDMWGETAVWAVVVAAVAVFVNAGVSVLLHFRRATFEERLATEKFHSDVALAKQKIALDISAADRKKTQDLAEEVLAGFYEVRSIIPVVRSPGSWGSEGKSRPPAEGETESIAKLRNTYYVVIERLEAHREVIARLFSKQYRMMAWFGKEAAVPFDELNAILVRVTVSARMLMMTAGNENPPPSREKWQADIWEGYGDSDEIRTKVDVIISDIEKVCQPVLSIQPINLANLG